jgi:hypothetical protein
VPPSPRPASCSHKAALGAIRTLWRLVQKDGITFAALVQAMGDIDVRTEAADAAYKVPACSHLPRTRGCSPHTRLACR